MKTEVHKTKVDGRDKSLACIMDAAVCIQKRENQLGRTKRDLLRRAAKYTEVDGGNFENLL